jgi:predicted RNA-binding protein YlqC (UPF0109 family)
MKALVETIVRGLVDHPDEVQIDEDRRGRYLTFHVRVREEDRGHVIGRGGSTASALRTLLNGLGQRDRLEVSVEIPD